MARPKQQHYVTKAYLEGFLRPSHQHLVCYGRGRGPFRSSPEDLACQRNYYAIKKNDGTWDDSIETLIGETVEGPGLPIIQKLASGNTGLSWQERNRISLLIAFQEMRTPSARERTRVFSRALHERVSRDIKAANPQQNSVQIVSESGKTSTVTLDEMIEVRNEICDDHSMEIHRTLVGAALKLCDLLRHMKFTIHYPTGNEEFVTTDTPVIRVFHSPAPLGTGINRLDVEIRFPLSRKAFLTLTHDAKLIELLEGASGPKRSRLLEALPDPTTFSCCLWLIPCLDTHSSDSQTRKFFWCVRFHRNKSGGLTWNASMYTTARNTKCSIARKRMAMFLTTWSFLRNSAIS